MIPNTSLPKTPAVGIYKALISQDATNAPEAIIIQNTTGLTWTWTRANVGVYAATPDEKPIMDKMLVIMPHGIEASFGLSASPTPDGATAYVDYVTVITKDQAQVAADGVLYKNAIIIEIYK